MQNKSNLPANARCQQGFTLVELAITTVIIALLLAMFLGASVGSITTQSRTTSQQRLKNLEVALSNYVTINRRLPCPADGTVVAGPLAGVEAPAGGGVACTANQANGVIPWATIGLSLADGLDGWNNQITYRVAYGLTVAGALDMSNCDPAGTAPASGTLAPINRGTCALTCTGTFVAANCTSPTNFLANRGLNVSTGATTIMDYTANTGAAYVMVSHGENGYGAIGASGVYQNTALRNIAGTTLEDPNRNNVNLTVLNGAPPQFIDATYSNAQTVATYFDDMIIRPSVMAVISKAQLGPRSH